MERKGIKRLGKRSLTLFILAISLIACKEDTKVNLEDELLEKVAMVEPDVYEFGFNLNDYVVL